MKGQREHCLDCGATLDHTSLAAHRMKCQKPGGRQTALVQRLNEIDTELDQLVTRVKTLCRMRVKTAHELAETHIQTRRDPS